MIVASGQASGPSAVPELAEQAVRAALARAGLARAERVLLLLSRDFARHPQPALRAAAGAAACLQIAGGTASGLFTEDGWLIDQAAAAALVFAELPATGGDETPLLSFSGQGRLPWDWPQDRQRVGLVDSDGGAWQQARECADARSALALPGLRPQLLLSRGLQRLGAAQPVTAADAHELRQLAGSAALDNLRRHLPGELRTRPPLHQLCLLRAEEQPGIAILSANSDGSLTLAAPLQPGDEVFWGIRQPLAAEQEICHQLDVTVNRGICPKFALMFSCIGRGPLFYGDDDRDLCAFRAAFPGVPLLGAYGTGQIVPGSDGNRMFNNALLTLLYESADVQPHP